MNIGCCMHADGLRQLGMMEQKSENTCNRYLPRRNEIVKLPGTYHSITDIAFGRTTKSEVTLSES